jgi:hypothetical protein
MVCISRARDQARGLEYRRSNPFLLNGGEVFA